MAARTYDQIYQLLTTVRDERRIHANTATRVGEAMLALLSYIANAPYLHKDKEDSTEFLLNLLAGAVIGETGQIKLNPDGSIRCGRITVDGSAVFQELVINRQNVLEGDTYFTDRGIIEELEYLGSSQFRLVLRKMYEKDSVTFHAYDVLRCSMNNLDTERTYKTSWMRVDSVDLDANSIDVTLYDDADVPGGKNFPPQKAARMVRWGNQADTSRQQVFFISAEDGRFLFLQGVTKPIIDDTSYSAFVGIPPELDILKDIPLNRQQPYIYARGLIVQDIIKIDYKGNPQYTFRDRGLWDAETQYIHGYDEVEKTYITDRVWWGGCLWQAAVEKPDIGKEPRYNNADWVCLLGGQNMSFQIVSTEGDAFPAGKHWTTTLVAELYNAEMRITEDEIGLEHITWQRISEDTEGDIAWNIRHATGTTGLSIDIDSDADLPGQWTAGTSISFQCDIFLPEMSKVYSNNYSIVM